LHELGLVDLRFFLIGCECFNFWLYVELHEVFAHGVVTDGELTAVSQGLPLQTTCLHGQRSLWFVTYTELLFIGGNSPILRKCACNLFWILVEHLQGLSLDGQFRLLLLDALLGSPLVGLGLSGSHGLAVSFNFLSMFDGFLNFLLLVSTVAGFLDDSWSAI